MKKILVLASNPKQTTPLRLGQEVREIEEGLDSARKRDNFKLIQKHAVRPRDIQGALLKYEPQIVHFSGHGTGQNGLVLEDDNGSPQLLNSKALASLFRLFANDVECVLLNGCYSNVQAESIVEHIDYVIGMSNAITDTAAINFAVAFYNALGDGRTYGFAYEFACVAIELNAPVSTGSRLSRDIVLAREESFSSQEHLTPILLKRPGLVEKQQSTSSDSNFDNSQMPKNKDFSELNMATIQAGQERVEALERKLSEMQSELQTALPEHYQEALNWLKNNQKDLSLSASSYALKELSGLLKGLSEEEQQDFRWDIEKYIESVYYAISNSSFELLDEPVIGPSINIPKAYQKAFKLIEKKVPGRFSEDVTVCITKRFEYLLGRLFVV